MLLWAGGVLPREAERPAIYPPARCYHGQAHVTLNRGGHSHPPSRGGEWSSVEWSDNMVLWELWSLDGSPFSRQFFRYKCGVPALICGGVTEAKQAR